MPMGRGPMGFLLACTQLDCIVSCSLLPWRDLVWESSMKFWYCVFVFVSWSMRGNSMELCDCSVLCCAVLFATVDCDCTSVITVS